MIPSNRVFIRDLPSKTPEDELRSLFSKCGKIDDIVIKLNFAFIEYETIQSAQNAIRNFNNYNFHGAKLTVEQAKSRGEKNNDKKSEKCFKCGGYGHFAKDCDMNKYNENDENEYNYLGDKKYNDYNSKYENNRNNYYNMTFTQKKRSFKNRKKSPKRSFNESISDFEED